MSASSGYGTGGSGPVGPTIDTITGNVGGPIGPTANNINLLGAGGVVVTGNPGTSTLTITVPGIATQYDEDVGTAMPALGILNIIGGASTAGTNMNTFGSGNTVEVILNDSLFFPNTNMTGSQGVLFWGGDRFLHNYGDGNTFVGVNAGNFTLNPTFPPAGGNTGVGRGALNAITDADGNCAVGQGSLSLCTTGDNSTALGANALSSITTGRVNDGLGANAGTAGGGPGVVTGSYNIFIGGGDGGIPMSAGFNYTGAESSNVLIRNPGVVGESNVMRLGDDGVGIAQQDATYIAGVYNRTFASPSGVVQIDSTFRLGSSAGTNGQLLIGATGASPLWANLTSTGGSVVITNGPNTINLEASGTGAGASSFPTDIGIATEALGVLNIFSGASTAGNNMRTNGFGNTVAVILRDSLVFPNTNLSGTQGVLSWGGNTFIHNRGSDNTFVGSSAGNLTLTTGSATDNSFLGALAGNALTTGSANTLIGSRAGRFITTGTNNVAVGSTSLNQLVSGSGNIVIGELAGISYDGNESNNILLDSSGINGESDTIRIGVLGTHADSYMQGIYGSAIGATNAQVFVDNTGKLGTIGGTDGGNLSFMGAVAGTEILDAGTGIIGVYFVGAQKVMTTVYDNFSGAFTPGDGLGTPAEFTAPVDGFYEFTWNVQISPTSSGTQLIPIINVNGTQYASLECPHFSGSGSMDVFAQSISSVISLTAGDVVTFSADIAVSTTNPNGGFLGGPTPHITTVYGILLKGV